MKKLFSVFLLAIALLATTESKANLLITNTTPCAYTVFVYEAAPVGSCALAGPPIPVVVPPLGPVFYACTPGTWVVGVCLQETFPVPMPVCVGLSNPALPPPCAGFPPAAFGVGSCGANPVFATGFPSTLVI